VVVVCHHVKMFVIRSQQSYPRLRETTDVERTLSNFRTGWMLLRDLASFYSLERRLHDEIGIPGNSSSISIESYTNDGCNPTEKVCTLPRLPLEEIQESLIATGCTPIANSSDETDGLYDHKVRHQFIAARLSDYIGSLLQIPQVIKSQAFEDFLSYREERDLPTSETDQPRHESTDSTSFQWISEQMSRMMIISSSENNEVVDQQINQESNMGRCKKDFYQFLFQGCDMDEVEISIPRRAIVTRYEYVPAGWWLVFRITPQPSSPNVQFTLTLCDNDTTEISESSSSKQETSTSDSSSTQSTVLLTESISPNTRILQFSYRCEPGSSTTPVSAKVHDLHPTDESCYRVKYAMVFSNETNMLRAAQLRLCALSIPHEAFKAACYAVSDQLEVEKRRQRSPLLCHVINSSHSDPVCLVVEPFVSEDFPDINTHEFLSVYSKCKNELSNNSSIEAISSNVEFQKSMDTLEMKFPKSSSLPQSEDIQNKDRIKMLHDIVSELQKRLNFAEKERTEMQKEIDRLRQEMNRSTTPKKCIRCESTFHEDELSNKVLTVAVTAENEEERVRDMDERLQTQLYHLQERRKKLLEASKQTSLSPLHTDLITKIEKAIHLIQAKAGLNDS
jgi:hypothetical protein